MCCKDEEIRYFNIKWELEKDLGQRDRKNKGGKAGCHYTGVGAKAKRNI